MGRQLQKKKNKSSNPKISKHKNPRFLNVRPLGNAIIAKNWDKKQTLSQNYQRLGLLSRLNKPTGGVERALSALTTSAPPPLALDGLAPGEARIERGEDGTVVRVVYGKSAEEALDGDGDDPLPAPAKTEVVRKLEELAALGERKREREQSAREKEWVERLVQRHGREYGRMARDLKLNPYQQTEGDIRRRVMKWEKKRRQGKEDKAVGV